MDLPDGYRLLAPAWDDLEPAAEVLAADDLDDAGRVVLDTGFLRGQWERSGFDLATDAWVAVDATGTVVGYAQVTRDGDDVVDSWGVVHPAHRGRGVGSALLGRIEALAIERMAGVSGARFRQSVNAGDEAAAAMLRSRGLRLVRHFWHMSIEPSPDSVAGPAPSGVAITSPRSQDDLREVHALLDEAFVDHWGYRPEPFERWVQDRAQGSDYDPALWRLAWEDRRLVGALAGVVRGDQAWVAELGVQSEARGRGIGAALLHSAFEAFAARRVRSVVLVVDAANSTGATALYERVGMRVVKRFDVWERALDPPAGPAVRRARRPDEPNGFCSNLGPKLVQAVEPEEAQVIVRPETDRDLDAIREVEIAAFQGHPYSRQTEHLIVEALRSAGALELSLVAECDGEVVGHIAFSAAGVGATSAGWFLLGPGAVQPARQGEGIGRALVEAGLDALRSQGAHGCVLVGDPAFYGRFGFTPSPGVTWHGVPPENVLCILLSGEMPAGEVEYHRAFLAGDGGAEGR